MSWKAGYSCRKLVPITGEAGAGTDYAVPLTVYSVEALVVGSEAIDQLAWSSYGDTDINKNNPVEFNGTITSVEIWANTNMTGVKVGMFYTTNGDTLKCRSAHTIGNVTAGSKQTFVVSLATQVGDYIGMYWATGRLDKATSGGAGTWYYTGDTCIVDNETAYSSYAGLQSFGGRNGGRAGVVGLGGYCTDFPNDIRFTDNDGSTELDHWIKDDTADPATFWIEVADDLDDNQNIYIYWSKSGASSDSNGTNTFVFFDDFTDESISGWSGDTGDFTEADGYIKTSTTSKAIYPTGITTTNHSVDARMKLDTGARGGLSIRKEWETGADPMYDNGYQFNCRFPNSDISIIEGSGGSHAALVSDGHAFDENWQDAYVRMSGSAIKGAIADDELSTSDASHTTGLAYLTTATVTSGSVYWDDIRVRKYIDPEPVVGTPGALEVFMPPLWDYYFRRRITC